MPKTKSIAELQRELAAKQRKLATLKSQRAKLAKQLAQTDRQIAELSGSAAPKPKRKVSRKTKVAKKAKKKAVKRGRPRQKPLAQFIQDVLAKAGKAMQAKDVTAAVLKAGYKTKDKAFKSTVSQMLGKSSQFKRVRRGVYKLAAKK